MRGANASHLSRLSLAVQRSSAVQVECSPQVLVQQEAHSRLLALGLVAERNLDSALVLVARSLDQRQSSLDPQQVLGLVVLGLEAVRILVQQEARSLDLVVRQQVQQVQQVRTAESVRQLAETRSYLEVLYLARCLSRNDLA